MAKQSTITMLNNLITGLDEIKQSIPDQQYIDLMASASSVYKSIEQCELCSTIGLPGAFYTNSRESYLKLVRLACYIYDGVVEDQQYMGHHLPYCTGHVLAILEITAKLGLEHDHIGNECHQFRPKFGYLTCATCNETTVVGEDCSCLDSCDEDCSCDG